MKGIFCRKNRLYLTLLTTHPIRLVPGLFPRGKSTGAWCWSFIYTSTFPICLHGMERGNLVFLKFSICENWKNTGM
jgi:hypothetical protein